ncbi:MAG: rhomboid family intramembrane serine protease [Sedimentisphaerales bacterium]|nr:rhomboid family intramembrane serine protease [Sedimentisphaerales bacterium]
MIPLRDTIPSMRVPFVTWSLIGINALVFVFELGLDPNSLERIFYLFGLVPARYTHPRWAMWVGLPVDNYWPFLTSMFLHGGWGHIIGNMWTLWIFGDNVEDRMGGVRFLLFYLATGIVAGLTHWMINPHSTIPTIGASGAIAGVLGAYFLLFPYSTVITLIPILLWPLFIEVPAVVYLFVWFASQVFSGTLAWFAPANAAGVAWWAHVGGFVAGMVLHRPFLPPKNKRSRRMDPDEFGLESAWFRDYYPW